MRAVRVPSRPVRLRAPASTRLPPAVWRGVYVRAFRAFQAQNMTDRAATLAYHAILSIVPTLLVAVALLTLLGAGSLPDRIADEFADLVQDEAGSASANESAAALRDLVADALDKAKGGASVALVVSVLLAANGASSAFASAGRALNVVQHVEESRGFVRHKLVDVGNALLVIVLMAIAATLVVVGGGIAESLFSTLGLGDVARTVWSIVRLPIAAFVLLVAIGLVYQRAPDVPRRRLRLVSAGSVTALVAWMLGTFAFTLYVTIGGFGSAYGAMGGAVVLLFWLWLSSATFLFGASVDAEADRTRLLRGGDPAGPPVLGVIPDDDAEGGDD